ncbi:hypothetical protein Tco_0981939 [Tanacetum coccineum]
MKRRVMRDRASTSAANMPNDSQNMRREIPESISMRSQGKYSSLVLSRIGPENVNNVVALRFAMEELHDEV